jgi:pimeloyl-ACP methyl ester carboxylesterase
MNVHSIARILAFLFFALAGLAAHSETASARPSHPPRRLDASAACPQGFVEHRIQVGANDLYAREYAGSDPPIILMHGFPDNLHLYDRLVPYLCGRHLVLFDFLGWGSSDKPEGYSYAFEAQKAELGAVIQQLALQQPLLVAHDASGPAAINWALDHSQATGGLVLLNTFYHLTPSLSAPEAIAIFGDLLELRTAPYAPPAVPWSFGRLSQAIAGDPKMFRWLYFWQVGSFFRDEAVRDEYLPKLYRQFARNPGAVPAFVALNHDLGNSIAANTGRVPELASFDAPVRIIFGASDPYLNADLAWDFHGAFPNSELFLLPTARHYVQMDEPEQVASLILAAKTR